MIDPSQKLAATTLELSPDADAVAARTAFLKQLERVDFVPPEDWTAAVNRLGGANLPLTPDAFEELARYEQADVDEFVEQYWKLAPDDRQQRWDVLVLRCRDPEVREQLARLELGLKVAVKPHADEGLQSLAELARELYLLPKQQHSIRLLCWCAKQTAGPLLESRGHRFQKADPETAALEPQMMSYLIQSVLVPNSSVQFVAPKDGAFVVFSKSPFVEIPPMSEAEQARMQEKAERDALKALRQAANPTPATERSGCATIKTGWIWMVFLIGALSGIVRNSSSQAPPPYTPTPVVFPNIYKTERPAPFTPEQIQEFKDYDPKSGKPEPKGYRAWRIFEIVDGLQPLPPPAKKSDGYFPKTKSETPPEPLAPRR